MVINKIASAFNSTCSHQFKVQQGPIKSLSPHSSGLFYCLSVQKVYLNPRAYPQVWGYMVYVVMRVPPVGVVEAVMALTDVQVKNAKPGDKAHKAVMVL